MQYVPILECKNEHNIFYVPVLVFGNLLDFIVVEVTIKSNNNSSNLIINNTC